MRKLLQSFFIVFTAAFCLLNMAVAKVYYDIDFSSPRNNAGQTPSVSSSGEDISEIVFGEPLIAVSQDTTQNQFLLFNTQGNEPEFFYDQIQLNMYGTSDFYYISFDIVAKNLINSANDFAIFALQKISFLNNGTINISDQTEIPYVDDKQYLFEIQIDYGKKQIIYFMDKKKVYTDSTYAMQKFDDIRFSLGRLYGNQENDTSSFVGIDNIYISDSIPVEKDQLVLSQKVDQSQKEYDHVADLAGDGTSGQTFTADTEGRLTGIRLLVQGSGSSKPESPVGSDIRVELRRIYPNGALRPTVVASGVTTRKEIVREEPKWIEILFERPYKQRAGEKLAFTITDLSGGGDQGYNNYGFAKEDVYAGGFSFMSFSKSPLQLSKSDMAFETLVTESNSEETLLVGPARDSKISFPPPPQGEAQKLAIIWADGNTELAHEVCVKYAISAKDLSWFDEMQLIVMGPSVKALAADKILQGQLKTLMDAGVEVKVSKDSAASYGVAKQLESSGVELRAVEHMLSQMILSGWKVITF